MTYNDSKIETYNFAVQGATVDQGLIDRGSAFSMQVGEKFLPNYESQGSPSVGGNNERTNRRRTSRNSGEEGGPRAIWDPKTTLFPIWFGINDVVFSNKSKVLFDRVFESYGRTVDQARSPHSLYLLTPFHLCTPWSSNSGFLLAILPLSSTAQAHKICSSSMYPRFTALRTATTSPSRHPSPPGTPASPASLAASAPRTQRLLSSCLIRMIFSTES